MNSSNAGAAGQVAPQKSEGQHAANALAFREQLPGIDADSAAGGANDQPFDLVSGEAEAYVYLRAIAAGRSRPGELLPLLSELEGHQRHGAARVIEQALGVRHG